jgi:hypothetical protein
MRCSLTLGCFSFSAHSMKAKLGRRAAGDLFLLSPSKLTMTTSAGYRGFSEIGAQSVADQAGSAGALPQ